MEVFRLEKRVSELENELRDQQLMASDFNVRLRLESGKYERARDEAADLRTLLKQKEQQTRTVAPFVKQNSQDTYRIRNVSCCNREKSQLKFLIGPNAFRYLKNMAKSQWMS